MTSSTTRCSNDRFSGVDREAAKNLPPPFREAHPEVPWKAMAGMRDRLIHAYLGGRSVRDVITHEIPAQKPLIHALLDICDA
jgi:uncharacterized protein with HEPN domain